MVSVPLSLSICDFSVSRRLSLSLFHRCFSPSFLSLSLSLSLSVCIRSLARLKERIVSLHKEIDVARDDFKDLHKERLKLLRDKEVKEKETETWRARCRELQLLKFGREIDLDELEASSDRTKEREVEAQLAAEREKFEAEASKLLREVNGAKEKLVKVSWERDRDKEGRDV